MKCNGLGILFSIGKWGGVYFARGWAWRLALGWVAVTLVFRDGDDILKAASLVGEYVDRYGPLEQQAALDGEAL